MIDQYLEWQAAQMSPRFELFREAKALYLTYTRTLTGSFPALNLDDFARATADAGIEGAEALFREAQSLAINEEAFRDAAVALYQRGMILHLRGDFSKSEEALREALEITASLPQMAIGDVRTVSGCLFHLGILAARRGEFELARPFLDRSLELDRETLDVGGAALSRDALEHYWPSEDEAHHA